MSREKWKLLRWRLLLSRPRHSPFLLFPPPFAISIAINIRSYTHSQTRAHGFAYPRTHSHTHPPVLKHNARRRRRLNPRWDGDGKLFPCYIKSFSFFRGVQPPPAPSLTIPHPRAQALFASQSSRSYALQMFFFCRKKLSRFPPLEWHPDRSEALFSRELVF